MIKLKNKKIKLNLASNLKMDRINYLNGLINKWKSKQNLLELHKYLIKYKKGDHQILHLLNLKKIVQFLVYIAVKSNQITKKKMKLVT